MLICTIPTLNPQLQGLKRASLAGSPAYPRVMDDRYSYESEGPARCRICGGLVHEKRVKGEMSMADRVPPIEIVRVCQNPRCDSNTGSTSISDAV